MVEFAKKLAQAGQSNVKPGATSNKPSSPSPGCDENEDIEFDNVQTWIQGLYHGIAADHVQENLEFIIGNVKLLSIQFSFSTLGGVSQLFG